MHTTLRRSITVSLAVAAVAATSALGFASGVGARPAAPARLAATPTTAPDPVKPHLRSPLPPDGIDMLRRFSQCMREHGFADYPDPSRTGELTLPEAYLHPGPALFARLNETGAACKRAIGR